MPRPKRHDFPVVVHVLLWREGSIFLLERTNTGFMDGYYSLPGGHQLHGESVSEAAIRECREETGAMPSDLTPRCVLPYISGQHQGLNFVFEAHNFDLEPRINEPELFGHCLWASPHELPERTAAVAPGSPQHAARLLVQRVQMGLRKSGLFTHSNRR